MLDKPLNTDPRTLDGVRNILTVKNSTKLLTSGPIAPGTEIRCLRRNSYGVYSPCVAFIGEPTLGGKFYVDLWADRSERVCVSTKAILWPNPEAEANLAFGKRGTATFSSQSEAENYLMKMPVNYAGATRKMESGKWMVSYRRIS